MGLVSTLLHRYIVSPKRCIRLTGRSMATLWRATASKMGLHIYQDARRAQELITLSITCLHHLDHRTRGHGIALDLPHRLMQIGVKRLALGRNRLHAITAQCV